MVKFYDFFKWYLGTGFLVIALLFCNEVWGQSNTSLGSGAYSSNVPDKFTIERVDVTNHGNYQFPVVDMGGVQGTWDYSSMYIYDYGLDFYGMFSTTSSSINPIITGGHGSGATLDWYEYDYDSGTGIHYYEIYNSSYGSGYGPEVTFTGGDGQAELSYYYINENRTLSIYPNTIAPYTIAPQVNISFGGATAVAVLSGAAANGNHTAIGYQALAANTTGNANTAIGFKSLLKGTTGSNNTALGFQSGGDLTTGYRNTFIGNNSGKGIATGYGNTIIGGTSSNLSANLYRTVILADGDGNSRFYSNSNGNVFFGYGNNPVDNGYRLDVNGRGRFNSNLDITGEVKALSGLFQAARFLGTSQGNPSKQLFRISAYQPLDENLYFVRTISLPTGFPVDLEWNHTTGIFDFRQLLTVNGNGVWHSGNFNPAEKLEVNGSNINQSAFRSALGLGAAALSNNAVITEGVENMAIGNSVLEVNTGFENVGVGERALKNNTSGTENTAVGVNAIISNITGSGNTALGNYVMTRLTTGTQNVSIGKNALNHIVEGSNNVALGFGAGFNLGSGNNAYNILIGPSSGANWLGSWNGSNNVILGGWSPSANAVMNNTMVFATGHGIERYRISENGNLLLGTSSENHTDKLQVQGSILAMASEQREVQSYLPDQYTTGDIVSGHAYKWYNDTWRLGNIRSGAMPSDGFGISFNHALQFKISSSGNVGIGVDTPGEKLSVNGNIKAKAVKVDPNAWPDYVFESDYHLPSLKETEHFIKANKHLPGVPSEEVESKGIDLGDMSAVLLKKIEELTLHQIELEKLIREQAELIKELRGEGRESEVRGQRSGAEGVR